MNERNTAQLIEIKKETIEIERRIEFLLRKFEKKEKIDFERPNDYSERSFVLTIYFDEFNVRAFENLEEIKNLYRRFSQLRKEQISKEKTYNSETKIKQDMKMDLRTGYVPE